MYVSIAVLNFNGRNLLEEFLPSLVENSKEHEIVVIDNASSDDSVEWLQTHYSDVRIVQLDKNYGFAGGYNRGLSQIEADVYIIINSDVKVTEGWIDPLLSFIEKDPRIAAVQPKIRSFQNPGFFEYAGAAGGYLDWFGYPLCRGRIFDTLERDFGQYDDCTEVFWTSGACMAIRASSFWEAGGFDEAFFAHQEEIDLCWRLQILGYSLRYEPSSVVYHLGGGTLQYQSARKIFLNFRNNLMMLSKNAPISHLFFILPVRLVLDGVAGLRYLVKGRYNETLQIIKAHFSFYANVGYLLKKRSAIHKKNNQRNRVRRLSKLVIIDYYVFGRKYFSDL
ncbi:MAG: glycosyltransferase family 2 protein [Thermaurantimonas sp.]